MNNEQWQQSKYCPADQDNKYKKESGLVKIYGSRICIGATVREYDRFGIFHQKLPARNPAQVRVDILRKMLCYCQTPFRPADGKVLEINGIFL